MKIIDNGHKFELDSLDGLHTQIIQYVKRCNPPEKYPGNVDYYPGTTMQEVCRAQISRAAYVNNQVHHSCNGNIIDRERLNIYELEQRAAERHGRKLILTLEEFSRIETLPTCKLCGHIQCAESCR